MSANNQILNQYTVTSDTNDNFNPSGSFKQTPHKLNLQLRQNSMFSNNDNYNQISYPMSMNGGMSETPNNNSSFYS